MGNMSYCRFENTVSDLEDCFDHFGDDVTGPEEIARRQMIRLCADIALDYGHEIGKEFAWLQTYREGGVT